MNANSYINTSVQDACSTLECRMRTEPMYVLLACAHTLVELQGRTGHKARRQMLCGMIRKALKQVPMEGEPHQDEVAEAQGSSNESHAGKAVYISGSRGGKVQYFPHDAAPATAHEACRDRRQSDL